MWRAQSIAIQVGVFQPNGSCVDLTDYQYLQLTIAQFQNSPTNFISTFVTTSDITPVISQADWLAGIAQQAEFDLAAYETDITLFAQPSQPYWIQLSGLNAVGTLIILAAGTINFYNAGSGTPAPVKAQTDYHAQTNSGGPGLIQPLSTIHTENVNLTGSGGTRDFILSAPFLPQAGARTWIKFATATPGVAIPAGITVRVRNLTFDGTILAQFTTDGYSSSAYVSLYFDGTDYGVDLVSLPAGY